MRSSLLRYPGGKFRQRHSLVNLIPSRLPSLTEPFAGGASVAIEYACRNPETKIWLNDTCEHVTAFWNFVIDHPDAFERFVSTFTPSVDEYSRALEYRRPVDLMVVSRLSHSGRGGGPIGGWDQSGDYKVGCRWNPSSLIRAGREIGEILRGRTCISSLDGVAVTKACGYAYIDPPYELEGSGLYRNQVDTDGLIEVLRHKKGWLMSETKMIDEFQHYKTCVLGATGKGGGIKRTEYLYVSDPSKN